MALFLLSLWGGGVTDARYTQLVQLVHGQADVQIDDAPIDLLYSEIKISDPDRRRCTLWVGQQSSGVIYVIVRNQQWGASMDQAILLKPDGSTEVVDRSLGAPMGAWANSRPTREGSPKVNVQGVLDFVSRCTASQFRNSGGAEQVTFGGHGLPTTTYIPRLRAQYSDLLPTQ